MTLINRKINAKRILHVYKSSHIETKGGAEKVIETILNNSKHHNDALFCSSVNSIHKLKKSKIIGFKNTFTISSSPFSIKLLIHYSKLIKNYDIIHYHFPWPFMDLLDLLFNKSKPTVVTYHSDIVKQILLKVVYYPLMLLFLKKTKKIICTSSKYLNSSLVLKKFNNKCVSVPIGIEEPKVNYKKNYKKNIFSKNNYFIFVGVLRYYKGIEILLNAVKINKINLLILGYGPLSKKIKEIIKLNNLNNVKVLSGVSDNLKYYYIKQSIGLILPSIFRSEAFGISLLEGAALKKPLISTEINTGTTFINKNKITGLVVPPNNEIELSNAMIKIKNSYNLQKIYGQNSYHRFKSIFNSNKMIKKYDEIYKNIN